MVVCGDSLVGVWDRISGGMLAVGQLGVSSSSLSSSVDGGTAAGVIWHPDTLYSLAVVAVTVPSVLYSSASGN